MNKKIIALILGILFTFLLLEMVLSFTGFAMKIQNNNFDSNKKIILGVGNSHMLGWGAPSGHSMPSYLQRLIDENNLDYEVINLGIVSYNSYQVLEDFEKNILKYDPKIIILQTGSPNFWNHYGFKDYYKRNNIEKSFFSNFNFLYNIKTYNFFKNSFAFRSQEDRFIEKQSSIINSDLLSYNVLYRYLNDKNFRLSKEDIVFYENYSLSRINDGYNDITDFMALSIICFINEDIENSIDYFLKVLDFNESSLSDFYFSMFINLEPFLENSNEIKDLLNKDFTYKKYDGFDDEVKINWILSDVEQMFFIAKKYDIELIILNYPERFDFYSSQMEILNKNLIDFAKENDLVYFDVENYFKKNNTLSENIDNYYEISYNKIGNHFNEKGYEIVAYNVYDLIFS